MRTNRIYELRMKKKISQTELAKRTGIARTTLGDYERHESRIKNRQHLAAICRELEIDVSEIYSNDPYYEKHK